MQLQLKETKVTWTLNRIHKLLADALVLRMVAEEIYIIFSTS